MSAQSGAAGNAARPISGREPNRGHRSIARRGTPRYGVVRRDGATLIRVTPSHAGAVRSDPSDLTRRTEAGRSPSLNDSLDGSLAPPAREPLPIIHVEVHRAVVRVAHASRPLEHRGDRLAERLHLRRRQRPAGDSRIDARPPECLRRTSSSAASRSTLRSSSQCPKQATSRVRCSKRWPDTPDRNTSTAPPA